MSDGIEDLKIRIKNIPISEIIGKYIALSRKGHYHLGLCPFHNDSSPSLQVNDQKGMFMCFVDQIGGDAITFVRKKENLSYMDALKDICSRIGISWDEYYAPKEEPPKMQMAKRVLSKAALLYQKVATDNSKEEFTSFVKTRNLKPETIKEFQIGLAPGNNILTSYLESIPSKNERNLAIDTALEIGIIRKDKNKVNAYFDTFRDRIMFPIFNSFGDIVGFSGRKTKESQKGKYINSDQSFIFNKKNILYGYHLAKNSIRDNQSVILVEGQMDVIGLFKNGIRNAVAVMGVGLGEAALKNLKGLTNNFYLALDSDEAGFKAMQRINEMCLSNDIIPKYLDFSPHKDPDEFLENRTKDEFFDRRDKALPFIDILIRNIIPSDIPELSDKKLEILKNIFPFLAPLKDSLSATERIMETAKHLGLKSDSATIINFYAKFLSDYAKNDANNAKPQVIVNNNQTLPISNSGTSLTPSLTISTAERRLIEEIIRHPECLSSPKMAPVLENLNTPHIKNFILKMQDFIYEIDEIEYVQMVQALTAQEEISQSLREVVGYALFKYEKAKLDDKIISRLLDDFNKKLKEELLIEKRNILRNNQPFCSTKEEAERLMQEISSVDKELMGLKVSKKK